MTQVENVHQPPRYETPDIDASTLRILLNQLRVLEASFLAKNYYTHEEHDQRRKIKQQLTELGVSW